MKTIFYIGWFLFMVITSPFALLKMKLDQRFFHHKDLMHKGKNAICIHCGKIVLSVIFISAFSISGFSQIKVNPISIVTNPTLSDLKSIKPTKKDSTFIKRIIKSSNLKQTDSSELYVQGDSVFVVHYFYDTDSTHPYRVGGGYVGKTDDFKHIMGNKNKFKFKNR